MDTLPDKCLLCGWFEPPDAYRQWFTIAKDHSHVTFLVTCQRCGEYVISEEIATDTDGRKRLQKLGMRLSAASRQATDRGKRVTITGDNAEAVAAPFSPPRDRSTYFDRVLEELAEIQPNPGLSTPQMVRCQIAARVLLPDLAVAGILQELSEVGAIHLHDQDAIRLHARLRADGWKRVDDLRRGAHGRRNRAFVAMWFDDSMNSAYQDGIHQALVNSGYEPPFRVNDPEHDIEERVGPFIPRIDDRIFAEIHRSRFVIVDVTGQRTAVYYEAGFAEGLGIPIIWCCRVDRAGTEMSFDTRQNEHIMWTDPSDLRAKLEAKIARRGWNIK